MGRSMAKISGLEHKQPLFKEFCNIRCLNDGDLFAPVEYLSWCGSLTLSQQLEIIRRYDTEFKIKNCNM